LLGLRFPSRLLNPNIKPTFGAEALRSDFAVEKIVCSSDPAASGAFCSEHSFFFAKVVNKIDYFVRDMRFVVPFPKALVG
jgi:hypothetical protein